MDRAVAAARQAFDEGPWPRMTHAQRAEYLRALGAGLAARADDIGRDLAPRVRRAPPDRHVRGERGRRGTFDYYAGLADTFDWEQRGHSPASPGSGCSCREPVGVVGAIIPWNAPIGPDQLQDRARPHRRLHGGPQVVAGSARRGLPGRRGGRGDRPAPGRAQRGHRRPRGVRAAGPRPDASTRSPSPARRRPAGGSPPSAASGSPACTLELGGKSAAVVLDDADLGSDRRRGWPRPSA